MKRNPILTRLVLAAAAASLGGCGLFHERSDYYTKATETRPLEVPPDLDTPPSANELVVPQAGAGATAAAGAAVSSIGSTELRVADNVQSTWQRVGTALDRSKVGTVSVRDENAHSYTRDFSGSVSTVPERDRHWYTPVLEHLGFGDDEKKEVTRHVTVQIADDAGASRISVISDGADRLGADSARRVVDVLRQSLTLSAPVAQGAPADAPAAASAAPPAAVPSAPISSVPPAPGIRVEGADLRVSDTVEHTFTRVGLALERAQIGTVSGRDEAGHTYTLDFSSTVEAPAAQPEHHWYSRILHPFGGGAGKTEQVKRSLVVRVAEDSGGAKVSVEGDTSDKSTADAARRVIEVLRDRLS